MPARQVVRAAFAAASAVLAITAVAAIRVESASADVLRHARCTDAGVTRDVELRSVDDAPRFCDVVVRTVGAPTEKRVLHAAPARSAFCRARFEESVRALSDNGWRCSFEPRPDGSGMPPSVSAPDGGVIPSARAWREVCIAARVETDTDTDAAERCDCAIAVLNEAGFEERDFDVLVSPYAEAGVDRPVHRAALLYGVGMMAVDALARCETR